MQTYNKTQSDVTVKGPIPKPLHPAFLRFVVLTGAISLVILAAFANAVLYWSWVPWVVLPFAVMNALWIAGGAATAILGLKEQPDPFTKPPKSWTPRTQTAILVTLCGENPAPLATYLGDLSRSLARSGLAGTSTVFVLSDTTNADAVAREVACLGDLVDQGRILYRRRTENTGKKPGNIAQWLHDKGAVFDFMLVLDSDSRMSVPRIEQMIYTLEQRPRTGLLQASISLIPGKSRFGRHQRNASRLLSRNFGRGFAAWSGKASNYWGHNAIMRLDAFRVAAKLPHLSGRAPFGGPLLSHDFIEAAWMKRAGWDVELDADVTGSSEDAPQTFQDFFKRDRRWCQGNLQHIRMLKEPGLHLISRLHLILGVFSYLAAPIWFFFVAVVSVKALSISGLLPFVIIVVTLLVPKFCALGDLMVRARSAWRRRIILRAWLSELALSTALAPLIMLRQTAAVGSVLLGRDSGWKSNRRASQPFPLGIPEAIVGIALIALCVAVETIDLVWLAPIFAPLLCAPLFMRALEVRS